MHEQRMVGGEGETVVLADGTRLTPGSVQWCTGFRPDHPWRDVPGALDQHGHPVHVEGRSPVSGLHWIGLPWQTGSTLGSWTASTATRRLWSHV